MNYAKTKGLNVIVTPFDNSALEEVKTWNIDALKIASCDLTNLPLVKNISETGFPVIVSTGMSNESEILKARDILEKSDKINIKFLDNKNNFSEDDWLEMHKLSIKTYVEESEESKSRTAGAGLTDND